MDIIEHQLKLFLDTNFDEEYKFTLIKENYLSAIMENQYDINSYPLLDHSKNMKSNNHVINAIKHNYVSNIIKDFNSQNIPVLYFKGEILQTQLFQNPDLRPVGDIDLYVFPNEFSHAMSLLQKHGFVFKNDNSIYHKHHIQYVKGHIKLELHKHIFNPFINIREDVFFKHLIPYEYENYMCLTFDSTTTILHLLYHLYMDTILKKDKFDLVLKNNVNMALRFLFRAYEFAKYINKFKNRINWEIIISDIGMQRLTANFKNMTILINHIFPNTIPDIVFNTIMDKDYIY